MDNLKKYIIDKEINIRKPQLGIIDGINTDGTYDVDIGNRNWLDFTIKNILQHVPNSSMQEQFLQQDAYGSGLPGDLVMLGWNNEDKLSPFIMQGTTEYTKGGAITIDPLTTSYWITPEADYLSSKWGKQENLLNRPTLSLLNGWEDNYPVFDVGHPFAGLKIPSNGVIGTILRIKQYLIFSYNAATTPARHGAVCLDISGNPPTKLWHFESPADTIGTIMYYYNQSIIFNAKYQKRDVDLGTLIWSNPAIYYLLPLLISNHDTDTASHYILYTYGSGNSSKLYCVNEETGIAKANTNLRTAITNGLAALANPNAYVTSITHETSSPTILFSTLALSKPWILTKTIYTQVYTNYYGGSNSSDTNSNAILNYNLDLLQNEIPEIFWSEIPEQKTWWSTTFKGFDRNFILPYLVNLGDYLYFIQLNVEDPKNMFSFITEAEYFTWILPPYRDYYSYIDYYLCKLNISSGIVTKTLLYYLRQSEIIRLDGIPRSNIIRYTSDDNYLYKFGANPPLELYPYSGYYDNYFGSYSSGYYISKPTVTAAAINPSQDYRVYGTMKYNDVQYMFITGFDIFNYPRVMCINLAAGTVVGVSPRNMRFLACAKNYIITQQWTRNSDAEMYVSNMVRPSPIIDCTYSLGDTIYMLDIETMKIVKQTTLAGLTNYTIPPIAIANGNIFIASGNAGDHWIRRLV